MIPIYIFGSGQKDPLMFYAPFLKKKAIMIAIDGGANVLKELNILPDWIIGDFDSILPEALEWLDLNLVRKIQYPKEKDFSDFELTCQKIVMEYLPTQVELFCMQGKRSDHFLFNLSQGEWLLDHGFNSIFHSQEETIYFIDSSHPARGKGKIGDTVSLFSLKNSVLIHQTIGLKYCLLEERLYQNSTRGLSNVLIVEKFEVSLSEGQLILIHNRRK
jgi:thiamine pyrophosphokinase